VYNFNATCNSTSYMTLFKYLEGTCSCGDSSWFLGPQYLAHELLWVSSTCHSEWKIIIIEALIIIIKICYNEKRGRKKIFFPTKGIKATQKKKKKEAEIITTQTQTKQYEDCCYAHGGT